jgi:phosphoglycerate dehydrogenase-like enzyme
MGFNSNLKTGIKTGGSSEGNKVMYRLSVLDVMSEEVKNIILHELGDDYEIKFASSYGRSEQLGLMVEADFLWVGWPPVDAEMIEKAVNLKVIHKCGTGVDRIDLKAAKSRNIKVFITSGINAVPVSEMALLLIMAVLRRLVCADANLRKGKWLKTELRGKSQHLAGKTVGIIGIGHIGKNLAKILKGFECQIYYYDINRMALDQEKTLGVSYKPLDELLKTSDVVSLHAPLTPETEKMINSKTLTMMRQSAILINTARGGLVDEQALVSALRTGVIAGAGLDVFAKEPIEETNPLLTMDNVVLTPHIAGSTLNNMLIRTRRIARNLAAFLNSEEVAKEDIIL